MESGTKIRYPAVAGMFYPRSKFELSSQIDLFLKKTQIISKPGKLRAVISPHAGYVYSGQTAAWAFRQIGEAKPKHLILIGPSHHAYFEGLNTSLSQSWETPLGSVFHKSAKKEIYEFQSTDEPHEKEHCLEVQLPFLQKILKGFSITSFLTGFHIDEKEIAQYFIENYPDSFFLVSSDLSHYLPLKTAKEKDAKTIDSILKLDPDFLLSDDNLACGLSGILILLQMAKILKWHAKLLHYDTSFTASHDETGVVGYGAIGFYKS